MKTRAFVSIQILVLAVLITVGGCATGKKAYTAKENEELYGTWINADYNEGKHSAKFILKPDGTFEGYAKTDSSHYYYYGEYIIADKWADSEGNLWYKYHYSLWWYGESNKVMEPLYYLSKIDKSQHSLETVRSGIDYPIELGPDILEYTYTIHYRQE